MLVFVPGLLLQKTLTEGWEGCQWVCHPDRRLTQGQARLSSWFLFWEFFQCAKKRLKRVLLSEYRLKEEKRGGGRAKGETEAGGTPFSSCCWFCSYSSCVFPFVGSFAIFSVASSHSFSVLSWSAVLVAVKQQQQQILSRVSSDKAVTKMLRDSPILLLLRFLERTTFLF